MQNHNGEENHLWPKLFQYYIAYKLFTLKKRKSSKILVFIMNLVKKEEEDHPFKAYLQIYDFFKEISSNFMAVLSTPVCISFDS